MKHKKIIAIIAVAAAISGGAYLANNKLASPIVSCVASNSCVVDLNAYPDPKLTPGLVATSDFKELTAVSSCGTYSKCHRKTTGQMKDAVCSEYPKNCAGVHEIDHFCPLALGCADDIKNLWAEPEHIIINGNDFGFHTKDRLENELVLEMKAGKISPKDAQDCILQDWVKCYREKMTGKLGTIQDVINPDIQ